MRMENRKELDPKRESKIMRMENNSQKESFRQWRFSVESKDKMK